jgi:hypothetical protein
LDLLDLPDGASVLSGKPNNNWSCGGAAKKYQKDFRRRAPAREGFSPASRIFLNAALRGKCDNRPPLPGAPPAVPLDNGDPQ